MEQINKQHNLCEQFLNYSNIYLLKLLKKLGIKEE